MDLQTQIPAPPSAFASLLGQGQARYELSAGIYQDRELEVLSFEEVSRMNAPFVYDVLFATTVDEGELQAEVFGFSASLTIHVPGHDPRVIRGEAVSLEAIGAERADKGSERNAFVVRIAPRLWALEHRQSYRVFQNKNALDIARVVLKAAGVEFQSFVRAENHPPVPFSYQRGETDLAFLDRVLAASGIFYYFDHSADLPSSRLVLCDAARDTEAMTDRTKGPRNASQESNASASDRGVGYRDGDALPYDPHGRVHQGERVTEFRVRKELRPSAASVLEWDPRKERPLRSDTVPPKVIATTTRTATGETVHKVPGYTSDTLATALSPAVLSVKEYGRDGAALASGTKGRYADRALAQLRHDWVVARGKSDCARMAPGYRFFLTDHRVTSLNGEYLVTEVRARGVNLDHCPGETETFAAEFVCVPATVDPCPPKPAMLPPLGSEPAEVIGAVNGDINTNGTAKIQVRFRWSDASDKNSAEYGTCWVRWREAWGGPGYGTQMIPRIGSEVSVEFPQQHGGAPIAVGYAGSEATGLPFEASKVGIRTQSLPPNHGGWSGLMFDDTCDAELAELRAERDMEKTVGRDERKRIGGSLDVEIGESRTERTGGPTQLTFNDYFTMQVASDSTSTVLGNRSDVTIGNTASVARGDVSCTVAGDVRQTFKSRHDTEHAGNVCEQHGGHKVVIVGDDAHERTHTLYVTGDCRTTATGEIEATSAAGLKFVYRGQGIVCAFTMNQDGFKFDSDLIEMNGRKIRINASEELSLSGKDTVVKGDSSATVKSPKTTLAGDSANIVLDANVTAQGNAVNLGQGGSSASAQQDETKVLQTAKVALTAPDGTPLAYHRVLVRKGADGEERAAVLDANGGITLDEGCEVCFLDAPLAKSA